MSDITTVAKLVSGIPRNLNTQNNSLVVGSLKVGSANPTELTKLILDKLILVQSNADSNGSFDTKYNTKISLASQANGSSGASLIGIDVTPSFSSFVSGNTVQSALEGIDTALNGKANSSHTHIISDITGLITALSNKIENSEKASPNGIATLDAFGKLSASQAPSLVLTDTFVVASEAAMLALSGAEKGDIVVRTDLLKTFVLVSGSYSTLSNWQELLTPTNTVQSVNGLQGTVVLSTTEISEGSNQYFTVSRAKSAAVSDTLTDGVTDVAPSQNAVFDALSLKAPLASPAFTGTVTGITKTMVGLGSVENTADSVKEVASSALFKKTIVAGEAMAANTSFAVRLAMSGETASRYYKSDKNAAVSDNFYVIGLALSSSAVSAGGNTTLVMLGTHTLGSSDVSFSANDIGKPVFLTSSGAFSSTAPSADNEAVCKIGIIEDVNKIFVQPAVIGVN